MHARDPITVHVDADAPEAMAWSDFAEANADIAAEVAAVLDAGDEYVGGGGAAPVFVVRPVDAYEALDPGTKADDGVVENAPVQSQTEDVR